jgi:hypothetical protein
MAQRGARGAGYSRLPAWVATRKPGAGKAAVAKLYTRTRKPVPVAMALNCTEVEDAVTLSVR